MDSEEIAVSVLGVEIPYAISWRSLRRQVGYHRSAYRGSGFKFDKIVPYERYPNSRRVNRRASQRSGEILVNLFEEEKNIDVVFLADLSGSQNFGQPSKLIRMAQIGAIFAHTARKLRDNFILIGYSDKSEVLLSGQRSKGLPLFAVEAILNCKFAGSGAKGLSEALELLPRVPSLILFASDFLPPKNFLDALIEIDDRGHDCIPIIFRDKWETMFPDGYGFFAAQDLETGKESVQWLSPGSRRKFQEKMTEAQAKLETIFREIGIEPIMLSPGVDPVETLDEYFSAIN